MPLPGAPADRAEYTREAASLAFDAGYRLDCQTDEVLKSDRQAFTKCATMLGWLAGRLASLAPTEGLDALVTFARLLNQTLPGTVHWKQTLAMKWQYTVTAIVTALSDPDREQLVRSLLPLRQLPGLARNHSLCDPPRRRAGLSP